MTRVRLLGNVRCQSSTTGERQALITRNGAALQGQPWRGPAAHRPEPRKPALAVNSGDIFELSVWHSAGASLNVEADSQTWFAMEVVE